MRVAFSSKSDFQRSNFRYGSLFYALIGVIALATALLAGAEIEPPHIFVGFLGGAVFRTVQHLLTGHPLLRRAYTITVASSLFVLATRDVAGKLAMVAGACFSVLLVSYYLEKHWK